MKIERKTPSITNEALIKQEDYFNCHFPKDYKEFLLEYNGGVPEKTLIYFGDDGGIIKFFLGFSDDSIYGVFDIYCRFIDRIPSNTLPIARDPGGNLFLMSIRGDDYGKIYFWDHEEESYEGEVPDYSNMTFVANSFTDLINNLKSEEELES